MVKLVILFKHAAASGNFELRFARNLALLEHMPGVKDCQTGKVLGGPAQSTVYTWMLELFFEDFAALDAALTSPAGVTAGKDLMDYAGADVELLFIDTAHTLAPQPLGPKNLQAYLDAHNIAAEIIYPGTPTPTVPMAAAALEVTVEQIVKSVMFLVNDQPFLVYGCGTRKIDSRKLAQRLNVGKKRVRLANADEVLDITGYQIGTVPPVGLKTPMPVFMDPTVQTHTVIYAGGGQLYALLKMTSAELLRVSQAEVVPLLRDEDTSQDQSPADS